MGFYINNLPDGRKLAPKNKYHELLTSIPESWVPVTRDGKGIPVRWHPDLVCVVENPQFDAALHVVTQAEFDYIIFNPDPRRKKWLIIPQAHKLSGYPSGESTAAEAESKWNKFKSIFKI